MMGAFASPTLLLALTAPRAGRAARGRVHLALSQATCYRSHWLLSQVDFSLLFPSVYVYPSQSLEKQNQWGVCTCYWFSLPFKELAHKTVGMNLKPAGQVGT